MFANIVSYQTGKSLSILQFVAGQIDTLEYISGSRALKEKKLVIQEITQGGSVNVLRGINESEFNIFLMDGDILEGAKQNRVLNTSVFIGSNSIIIKTWRCLWSWKRLRFWSISSGNPPKRSFSTGKNARLSLPMSWRMWPGIFLSWPMISI